MQLIRGQAPPDIADEIEAEVRRLESEEEESLQNTAAEHLKDERMDSSIVTNIEEPTDRNRNMTDFISEGDSVPRTGDDVIPGLPPSVPSSDCLTALDTSDSLTPLGGSATNLPSLSQAPAPYSTSSSSATPLASQLPLPSSPQKLYSTEPDAPEFFV